MFEFGHSLSSLVNPNFNTHYVRLSGSLQSAMQCHVSRYVLPVVLSSVRQSKLCTCTYVGLPIILLPYPMTAPIIYYVLVIPTKLGI